MKTHSTLGYQMIKEYEDISPTSKLIVLNHHEREDGSGYPSGNGANLHIGAKIVGACDILEALITERPYRRAVSLEQALLILRSERISIEVRVALEQLLEFYPIDTIVLLNTSEIGIVESTHSGDIKRPVVKTIYSLKNNDYISNKVDLISQPDTYIIKKLDINDTIRKILSNQP
jgi:HD-GYP domain-containing protein (c-di-GMP phosphodiesterase class II)